MHVVLLVELNLLIFAHVCTFTLYRTLEIQRQFARQVMGSQAVCHMFWGFYSADDSCYGALDCHTVWWIYINIPENTLSLKMEAVCVSETVVFIYHVTAVFNKPEVHAMNLIARTVTSGRAVMNIMPCQVVNTV